MGSVKGIGHVNQSTFPLPNLALYLRALSKALHSGHGFFIIRGLTPDKYSIADNIIIYTGISSYIGSIRGNQDTKAINGVKQSSMLNHIKDLSQTSVAGNIGAPAYTTDKQVFHTDAGDIISLFCLGTAGQGGESKLAFFMLGMGSWMSLGKSKFPSFSPVRGCVGKGCRNSCVASEYG
jgi:hypothetical protein